MNKEATKYCEECKNCLLIHRVCNNFWVKCKCKSRFSNDEVVYCKYKRLRKENKKDVE